MIEIRAVGTACDARVIQRRNALDERWYRLRCDTDFLTGGAFVTVCNVCCDDVERSAIGETGKYDGMHGREAAHHLTICRRGKGCGVDMWLRRDIDVAGHDESLEIAASLGLPGDRNTPIARRRLHTLWGVRRQRAVEIDGDTL